MKRKHALGVVPVGRHTAPGRQNMVKYEGERIALDLDLNLEQMKVIFDQVLAEHGAEYENIRLAIDDLDREAFFIGDREPHEIELRVEKEVIKERSKAARTERYQQYLLLKKEFED